MNGVKFQLSRKKHDCDVVNFRLTGLPGYQTFKCIKVMRCSSVSWRSAFYRVCILQYICISERCLHCLVVSCYFWYVDICFLMHTICNIYNVMLQMPNAPVWGFVIAAEWILALIFISNTLHVVSANNTTVRCQEEQEWPDCLCSAVMLG